MAWLEQESGVKRATIQNIASARRRTTELRYADALVQALDRQDLFYDGSLTIRPNPNAPAAARAACCGGSLTGSGALLNATLDRISAAYGRR